MVKWVADWRVWADTAGMRRFLGLGLMLAAVACAWGQETLAPAKDAELPMTTLHVYMDLIQVPVLVLDSEHERMKPIDPGRFQVSLDAGPIFHPKHVRQEGDDAITLGILIDANAEAELMPRIGAVISGLAPRSLHAKDHVSVYAMDCGLLRTVLDAPADAMVLKSGVDRALERWVARRKMKGAPPCDKRVGLWDAMGKVVSDLSELPGRRVMLAVTSGEDSGSKTAWTDLRSYTQWKGVAIFGYTQPVHRERSLNGLSGLGGSYGRGSRIPSAVQGADSAETDPFGEICGSSGGMVMKADGAFEDLQLTRFVTMVRERYILEFSRARNDAPGEHNIAVTVAKAGPGIYIRPAGVTIMLRDDTSGDTNVIPRDATDAPELGTRKVLGKPH